ncbi:unnamed protein product [Chrysodeixis includens]|uniref:Uncharacterized protein n=1 Tax=Chrysodeixis includens TaxID=689277 RepID=A0A9P0BY45_CHRIL|nr:unnamed protein product [Chrysodeixis includens]
MKESKAAYVTKRDRRDENSNEYQTHENKVRRDRDYSPQSLRYEQKTLEVGCQYDCKRDNLICTCKHLAKIRKNEEKEVRCFGQPKQIYAYHGTWSFTDIGVGSVKALQKKKVKRIYLPETDDRGVGSSDLSSYVTRRSRQQRFHSYYEQKRNSSKCVGGILEYNTGCVMNEKLSPIVHTVSGTTSPRDSTYNRNIEIGSNTVVKSLTHTTTQVEESKRESEENSDRPEIEIEKPEVKIEEIKPVLIAKEVVKEEVKEMQNKTLKVIKPSLIKDKYVAKDFSSDSLVQQVYNLENPSDVKSSRTSMEPADPMENKLEREYRNIFVNKSKEPKSSNEKNAGDYKSTSSLKRRFGALRRSLAKKEDSKKNSSIAPEITSPTSVASRKDVSINSDPPSLEGRSYSSTKPYNPFPSSYSRAKTAYDTKISSHIVSSYKRSVTGRKERGSAQWSSRPDDENGECQGVKGMFKLWGKKFNLEEDYYDKKNPTPSPYGSPKESSKKSDKKYPEPKLIIKDDIEEKKDGKRFFFFKKKNKYKNKPYKSKKGVTTGRCEVKDGLKIKIGGAGTSYIPETVVKEPEAVPNDYEDLFKRAWVTKFMSQAIESRNSVQVRWNNKTYTTSSSTVFELMDNVYKDTGVIFRSKSQVTIHSSYKSYTAQHVNFVHQNIEAWMVPKTLPDKPKLLPKIKCKSNEDRNNNIEVRISDQKWFIDKSKAFSHKIEVVLHSKNMVKLNKEESSEYLRIDIPKGFFMDSSSDENNKRGTNHSSDEEVFKIVEYETGSDLKKDKTVRNFDIGDHRQNNIKVTVSVKESKDYDIDTIMKQPPVFKNVSFQGSKVYKLKRCDVIGVGIITHRELRDNRKPILKIQDDYSDDEYEQPVLGTNSTKCELAESYLQDFYRHCTPLGIDSYSWCVSDSHLRCCLDNSVSYNNQGDEGTKSCPNIYDDFQTATIVSSCETSSCSHCQDMEAMKPPPDKSCKWFSKLKKKKDGDRRTLPKDSIEVFRRRKLYAASDKSKWACPEFTQSLQSLPPPGPCPPPPCPGSQMPSSDSKGGTLVDCQKLVKPCCKPIEPKAKKKACNKHVSLPNCDVMNDALAKGLSNTVPSGILAFKGAAGCDACKQKGYCSKHAILVPQPSCEIPRAACRDSCEKMKNPPCAKSKTSCENPPPPSCPETCPTGKKGSCPPSPPEQLPTPKTSSSCPSSPTQNKKSCPGSPVSRTPSPPNKNSLRSPCPSPPRAKRLKSPCSPPPQPKRQKSPCSPPPPTKKLPSCPSTPTRARKKQGSCPQSPARRPPSRPRTPPPCQRPKSKQSPPASPPCTRCGPSPPSPPKKSPGLVCYTPPGSPPPCRRPPSSPSPPPSPPKKSPGLVCYTPPGSPPPCRRPPSSPSPPPSPPKKSPGLVCYTPPGSPPPCRKPRSPSPSPPASPPSRRPPACSPSALKKASCPPTPQPCRKAPPCPSPKKGATCPSSPPLCRPLRAPPSCPQIPSTGARPVRSCPHSPPCPPPPPPCPHSPPCPVLPLACPHSPPCMSPSPPSSPPQRGRSPSPPPCPYAPACSSPPPCPYVPPCYRQSPSGPPARPKCNLPNSKSPKLCPASPPMCPASPPMCCAVEPNRCPGLPPPCKKSKSICKKLSPFFRKKPMCPSSPQCKPMPCKESYCKALACQQSPNQSAPDKKQTPSPRPKFSTTSCSYGSLKQRGPEAPYVYSPVHPCPPEREKPKKPAPSCNSPPCNKSQPKHKPPFNQSTTSEPLSIPPCDPCLSPNQDSWLTKNQGSNQSSITSLYKAKNHQPKEEITYKCTKKCPNTEKSDEESVKQDPCKKSCPNRMASPRPPCMPPMSCPPPRPTLSYTEPRQTPSEGVRSPKSCRSKSRMSGLSLKMKPTKKINMCSKDCSAWEEKQQDEGCISLNSEEKITIRLKKDTQNADDMGEGLNIKVQDEDGLTLFERKDYMLQRASMNRHTVLGDMYRASELRRVATTNSVKDLTEVKNNTEQITQGNSDVSIANLIEIQLKLKVTQGEKTAVINIANDAEKENEDNKIKTLEPVNKIPQEIFVVKDGNANVKPERQTDPKNDINIRIVIKNFKPKVEANKTINLKGEDLGKDFAQKISSKFHTVSTGYSDVFHDDNVFSVHRTSVDLTSSVDKTHSNKSREIMSDTLIGINKGKSAPSVCRCVMTDMSDGKIDCEDLKSISSRKYSTNRQTDTQEETDTDNKTTHSKHKYDTETEDSDKQTDHKYDTETTDAEKVPETKYDTEETDTDKPTAPKCDPFMSTDSDEQDTIPEEDVYIAKPKSLQVIVKPHTKDEKKEMLKQVFEKAYETKTKTKTRMRKLRSMLKVILTSDSSDHDDSKTAGPNDLAKDVTYASLKPNYFRDSDSMNNYYRTDSHDKLSGEINTQVVYPSVENNSDCSNSNPSEALSSENESTNRGCMCSTLAARLRLASRIGEGGGCCCGPKVTSKKNEETICDLKRESDYFQYDYKQMDYVDVETQNSNYLLSKINSTNLSTNKSIKSSILDDVDTTKTNSGVINVDQKKFTLPRPFSPLCHHRREYEMRRLVRNSILRISDDDKIILLSSKPTRINAECAKSKVKEKKKKHKDPSTVMRASDILQSYETKKAVLEIYTEKTCSNDRVHLVAKLPKFVYDRESEIEANYEAITSNTDSVSKRNIVMMMSINR